MSEVIKVNDNNIKFKAIQFYTDPPLMMIISSIGFKGDADYKLLMQLQRIRIALKDELIIVNAAVDDIVNQYPEDEVQVNIEVNKFLQVTMVEIPLSRIKANMTAITGIKSLMYIDVLEGIIEIKSE